ncbi:MAG: helix-turn-helix domain-containing protein [Pseudomonadota bacterium]
MRFGDTLTRLRQRERLSQLDLSLQSGVSQRHISFLETGRSNPGENALSKLTSALNLSFAETNTLYRSAGLIGPYRPFDFQEENFAPARRAIDLLLASHEPNFGVATLRDGRIVATNSSFERALDFIFEGNFPVETLSRCRGNLFDLTLHPQGLRRLMQNAEQIIPHTLRRLGNAAKVDQGAEDLLRRARQAYNLELYLLKREDTGSELASVLTERYIIQNRPLNLISMVASFGSPEDVTAEIVQIELFYPSDGNTEQTIKWLENAQ